MQQGKVIVVTVVVALLVAVLGLNLYNKKDATPQGKALADLKSRIIELKVLAEEQTLTRDIMLVQLEIKELQLKAKTPPVIEGEFIPTNKLPPDMK